MSTITPVDTNTGGKLTVNRVVLIFHYLLVILTIAGIFVSTLSNSLPTNWQNAALAVGGIITALTSSTVATNKFLSGSQNFDNVQAELIKSRNELEANKLYHIQSMARDANSTTDVTGVTGVTDVEEGSSVPLVNAPEDQNVSDEEIALPENLNEEQWLYNRNISLPQSESGSESNATGSSPTNTSGESSSIGISEPTTTAIDSTTTGGEES